MPASFARGMSAFSVPACMSYSSSEFSYRKVPNVALRVNALQDENRIVGESGDCLRSKPEPPDHCGEGSLALRFAIMHCKSKTGCFAESAGFCAAGGARRTPAMAGEAPL